MNPPTPIWPTPIVAIERRIVARLRGAHATVATRAIALDGLNRLEAWRLGQLAASGAVHESGVDRWHLDEPVYAERLARRRRMLVITVVAAALAAVTVSLLY